MIADTESLRVLATNVGVADFRFLKFQKPPIPNHDDFVEERLEPATAGKLISAESNCRPVA